MLKAPKSESSHNKEQEKQTKNKDKPLILNKLVFKLGLKESALEILRIWSGKIYQRVGPAGENDLSPHDFLLLGTYNKQVLEDRNI